MGENPITKPFARADGATVTIAVWLDWPSPGLASAFTHGVVDAGAAKGSELVLMWNVDDLTWAEVLAEVATGPPAQADPRFGQVLPLPTPAPGGQQHVLLGPPSDGRLRAQVMRLGPRRISFVQCYPIHAAETSLARRFGGGAFAKAAWAGNEHGLLDVERRVLTEQDFRGSSEAAPHHTP